MSLAVGRQKPGSDSLFFGMRINASENGGLDSSAGRSVESVWRAWTTFRWRGVLGQKKGTLCLSLAVMFVFLGHAEVRRFSVRDSIEMKRFGDLSEIGEKVLFSPNESYFVMVTSGGIIKSDKIESTLWLFHSNSVRSFLSRSHRSSRAPAMRLATIAAVPNGDAPDNYASTISQVRWSLDSQSIYFVAKTSNGSHQLYEVSLHSRVVRRLTPKRYDIRQFDLESGTLIYSGLQMSPSFDAKRGAQGFPGNYDAYSVTGMPLRNLLCKEKTTRGGVPGLWEIKGGHTRQIADQASGLPEGDSIYWSGFLSVSPKAHWVVQLLPVREVPPSWEAYKPAPGVEFYQIHSNDLRITCSYNLERLVHYALIDLQSGAMIPIIQGPYARSVAYGDRNEAVWSQDEHRLLLTNTFLSLEDSSPAERLRRARPCAVAAVEVAVHQVTCIVFSRFDHRAIDQNGVSGLTLRSASFGSSDDEVILTLGAGPQGTRMERYQRIGGTWKLVEVAMGNDHLSSDTGASKRAQDKRRSLKIEVRQSLNEPPVLWVTDSATGESEELWNPNPQLAGTVLGQASVYRWSGGPGSEWSGGLIKPIGYVPGKRYPLVIQTHGFSESEFMTEGGPPTAMAARALASAGFMVLQIPIRYDLQLSAEEATQAHLEFAAAIRQLSDEGLIDPHRVGVIGFSWTCLHVEAALIEDPKLFAAATIADGVDHSYLQYHLWGAENIGIAYQSEQVNGGKPWGEGLKRWIQVAPGFRLDRIQSPLRVEANSPLGLLGEWEIYSSLVQQQKAVDLVYFPEGEHVLQKPLERLASEQGNVDWFRFWLQGYEDPDPAKKDQYALWRRLRLMRTGETTDEGS